MGIGCSVICLMGIPIAIAGLVTGIMALSQIKKDPYQSGKEIAIVGIVLSGIYTGLSVVMLILAIFFVGAIMSAPGTIFTLLLT